MGELVPVPPGATRLVHDGRAYAVFEVDGETVVTDEACPHNGGPLSKGVVRDGAVVCPWHWYAFDLRSGKCRTGPRYALRRYPVVVREGQLLAELTPPARRSWSDLLRAHARGEDSAR
jgi:nitrite reductase (NADH) small subunit